LIEDKKGKKYQSILFILKVKEEKTIQDDSHIEVVQNQPTHCHIRTPTSIKTHTD
jgi:hypothetical protein